MIDFTVFTAKVTWNFGSTSCRWSISDFLSILSTNLQVTRRVKEKTDRRGSTVRGSAAAAAAYQDAVVSVSEIIMWCDVSQSCAMMGLQATAGKRKLEGGVGCMEFHMDLGESPSKLGRVDGSWWAMDDSYGPSLNQTSTSYYEMELGSSYRANERCCEGSKSSWCRRGRACYRQRRLAVLNISMCKLARYRQFPDPSLHRSVLICNTLRHLEREMERDRSPPPMEPVVPAPIAQLQPPEQGRLTPFPVSPTSSGETDVDSGIGDSDDSRSINWGSVLSLSSQSPLDPLNNNELLDRHDFFNAHTH
ncbi:Uncharacterized protein DBV15_09812 [Temnothorax longispinosus]|uniref:SERTA domain-containing protein n=1 Tax=Temnothorax longispinosus TaxID=300112 RepID=A0A4S2JSH4_9HYME|nr:Uncharacterized protein DBV15_09812 [Temnothorax longispinosus]